MRAGLAYDRAGRYGYASREFVIGACSVREQNSTIAVGSMFKRLTTLHDVDELRFDWNVLRKPHGSLPKVGIVIIFE